MKLNLSNITLLALSSVELDETELALMISSQDIDFGAIKFLYSGDCKKRYEEIEYLQVPSMNLRGYSKFILEDLYRFVETEYCLVIQADGFVLDAARWSPEFLKYDYIGAPWPQNLVLQPDNVRLDVSKNCVGNGGFSLRSKRLLLETANIDFDSLDYPCVAEDFIICHYLFPDMQKKGVKFCPPELAAQFSIESPEALYGQMPGTTFGFHGKPLRDLLFRNV